MSRLPAISEEDLTDAQRPAYNDLASERGVRGPYIAWLRNPEFASLGQKMGSYLRHRSSIPKKLNEFAISITTRHWLAQYAFHSHSRQAVDAGLNPKIISAIIERRKPDFRDAGEEAVYNFCQELNENHAISDSTYDAALERFGENGVVDLISVCGYYALVSMTLVATNAPLPAGIEPPLPD